MNAIPPKRSAAHERARKALTERPADKAEPRYFGPTPEFQQHHNVIRPTVDRKQRREAYEVRTRLAMLVNESHEGPSPANAHWIGPAELVAAVRYRDAFDQAEGLQDKGVREFVDGGRASDGITDRMVAGAAHVRAVRTALGPMASTILRQVVVHDTPWRELGRMIGVHHDTAKGWACDVLRGLLAFYDQMDRVGAGSRATIRAAEFE